MKLKLNNNRKIKLNKMNLLIKQQAASMKNLNKKINHNKSNKRNKNKILVVINNSNSNRKFIRKRCHGLNQ